MTKNNKVIIFLVLRSLALFLSVFFFLLQAIFAYAATLIPWPGQKIQLLMFLPIFILSGIISILLLLTFRKKSYKLFFYGSIINLGVIIYTIIVLFT